MRVGIIGSGYVGLVTGVSLAERGHTVVCIDSSQERINSVGRGLPPFHEPGLEELLNKQLKTGRLETSNRIDSVLACDTGFVAVATPSSTSGAIDTTQIEQVAVSIGTALREATEPVRLNTLFVKSTVVPETTRRVFGRRLREAAGERSASLPLGMMPEFLREGSAVQDAMFPDRVIVGGDDPRLFEAAQALYCSPTDPKIFATSLETAELIKYTNNALLSLCISFANEIAAMAESIPGVDAQQVFDGVMMDHRWKVGSETPGIAEYFKPGCGFGGSCFPKDVKAISAFAQSQSLSPLLLPGITEVNRRQPVRFVDRIEAAAGSLQGLKVLLLGLSFKPATDDVRESPALNVAYELELRGANVACSDPVALAPFLSSYKGQAEPVVDWRDAARRSDVVVLVTAWNEYVRELPGLINALKKTVILADGRGVFRETEFAPHVQYVVIGRSYVRGAVHA